MFRLFLFLNKGRWNWICVMGCGMRENITQLKEFFIVASKKKSFASTALLLIVWVLKFNHGYGCRCSWKSESQKLHKSWVFHAYSLHACQNRGRAEYLPAKLSSSCIAVAVPILSKEPFGPSHLAHPIVSVTSLVLGSQGQTEHTGCWPCLLSTQLEDIIERISANFISRNFPALLISSYDTGNGETLGP